MQILKSKIALALILVFSFARPAFSQDAFDTTGLVEVEPQDSGSGSVSIERQVDLSVFYKKRRSNHGVIFGLGAEKFYPKKMLSLLDDVTIDRILANKPINLVTLELGYKYNFLFGALSLTYGYAKGKGTGDFNSSTRSMDFQRQTLSASYYADNLLNEPWVVPYGSVGISQFTLAEEEYTAAATVADDSITTDFSLNYKVGLLIQLNWIESGIDNSTHYEGLKSSGLENTFLDIHLSWYDPTQNLYDPSKHIATKENDPDLRAEAQLGIGIKLEF